MLDIEFGQASHPGKVRTNNEDSTGFFCPQSRQEARSRGWLFVLADGVGGLDLGEVASAKAVEVICSGFAEAPEHTFLPGLLPRLIQHANAAVHDEGLARERRGKPMGTTVVACALRHDQACIAHVGDSRCYHVRQGRALPVTHDHTWVNEQRRLGLISQTEAADSDSRHVLTRSLGPELFVTADETTLSLRAGDFLVLCCDGLHDALSDRDIAKIVSRPGDLEAIAQELVNAAVEADGSDNTTAQIIAVRSVEAMAMYRGRLYPRPVG
ncbi:MAG TPA: protein phosphatase 2C domain-containing protein [Acidobacteriaceae bacterium]|jgi:protein phosphatase|nr:protein phosphatase 2C domain-containing protein [Acidobacteriaceae bacterium]